MSDFSKEDELFMKELKIGDIFKSYNNYSYIYYLGIDNDRRINKEGYAGFQEHLCGLQACGRPTLVGDPLGIRRNDKKFDEIKFLSLERNFSGNFLSNGETHGTGEYMFNSVTIDYEYSIIYHYTKQGVCIGLCNYEKISRNILNREIIFNMIKKILLKETKLPEDIIFYIKDFL